MSIVSIRCPRCGKSFQTDTFGASIQCVYCERTFPLPRALQKDLLGDSEHSLVETVDTARLNEGFSLLETDMDSPVYDNNLFEAMGTFMNMVKDNKANYLAWSGLFGCLLGQCKKTYRKWERIPDTEYWLLPGTSVYQNHFRVEGYFYQVSVDESGKFRSVLLDTTLQPGRKARVYLENAVEHAEGEEQEKMQKLLDAYFTNAPAEMARTGFEYQLKKRAEAREQAEKRLNKKDL